MLLQLGHPEAKVSTSTNSPRLQPHPHPPRLSSLQAPRGDSGPPQTLTPRTHVPPRLAAGPSDTPRLGGTPGRLLICAECNAAKRNYTIFSLIDLNGCSLRLQLYQTSRPLGTHPVPASDTGTPGEQRPRGHGQQAPRSPEHPPGTHRWKNWEQLGREQPQTGCQASDTAAHCF